VSKRAKAPPGKPPDEYSAFKELLGKIAKVPKAEADEKEVEYQQRRTAIPKKNRA
jgi:hypothetical protein